jgi:predicted metal-dependent hydrolase
MKETLIVGGLGFEVRRSRRRRTLGLVVDRGGELVVHAPESAGEPELTRWVQARLLWVHRKLALKAEAAPKVREPEFVSGESFSYLGRSYRLSISARQDEALRFDGRRFFLRRDARSSAGDHFRQWYIAVGRPWLQRRVGLLSARAGVVPSRVEVRDLGFRWGSCGRGGAISFNWRLLQLPVRLADYVIAHELAHLAVPNHGAAFWSRLDRSMPDWTDRKQELAKKAQDIYWCKATMVT